MKDRIILHDSIEDNATVDDLKFILSQAKDRISVQTEDAEKLYQRSVVLMTVCITVITAVIGYVGTHLTFIFPTVLLGTIGILMWRTLALLKTNIIPADYWGIGSEPVTLATEAFFTDFDNNKAEWHMLYSEIISFQQRIDANKENNEERATNLKDAINCIYWIPLISILVLALFIILGRI